MLVIRVSSGGIDAGRDRVVEVALDQAREPLVEGVGLGLEHAPRADRVQEQQPRHRPVAGERREHRVDRRLGPRDGLGLERHRPLDPGDELVGGRLHELAEDRFLGREVEVDAALGGLGGARDVVHRGVPVAAGRERVERGVEDPLAAAAALLGGIGAAHRVPRARGSDRPTGRSVHRHAIARNLVLSRRTLLTSQPQTDGDPGRAGVSLAPGMVAAGYGASRCQLKIPALAPSTSMNCVASTPAASRTASSLSLRTPMRCVPSGDHVIGSPL